MKPFDWPRIKKVPHFTFYITSYGSGFLAVDLFFPTWDVVVVAGVGFGFGFGFCGCGFVFAGMGVDVVASVGFVAKGFVFAGVGFVAVGLFLPQPQTHRIFYKHLLRSSESHIKNIWWEIPELSPER